MYLGIFLVYIYVCYPHFEIFKIHWVSGHGNTIGAPREKEHSRNSVGMAREYQRKIMGVIEEYYWEDCIDTKAIL